MSWFNRQRASIAINRMGLATDEIAILRTLRDSVGSSVRVDVTDLPRLVNLGLVKLSFEVTDAGKRALAELEL